MPQLDQAYFLTQIFWLGVSFIFLYWFTSYYFFPRISKIVEGRKERVKSDLAEAESLAARNKNLKAKINELLENSRLKASKVKAQVVIDCEKTINTQITKLEKELMKEITTSEEKLLRYKVQLEKEAEELSEELSHEVISVINSQVSLANKSSN